MADLNSKTKILRLIDANLNRVKEGLRVVEDILRFISDEDRLTAKYKRLRHRVTACMNTNKEFRTEKLVEKRSVDKDVGKKTQPSEAKRRNVSDILRANHQRAKESLRVLEEFTKLSDTRTAASIKKMRYELYALEKQTIEKTKYLCHN